MPTDFPEQPTDITSATEISDGLPGALVDRVRASQEPGRLEDHTAFVDPVEQAILVDRTRGQRGKRAGRAASARDLTGFTSEATGLDVRSTSEEPGDGLFGHYRVVAPLAGGNSATLLLAEHCTHGFPVAIKVLQPALVGSQEAEHRFFAEAMLAARIGHPGVPTVLDFGYDQRGIAYLAIEYLEGETLGAHLDGGSLFSLDQVLEIGAQTAAIMAAAHACGVAHGALGADRIHIFPDAAEPSGLRVKVLDFGPHVPEHATAEHALADIHALGCVIYRLLAGRLPFDSETQARAAQDPPPPRAHRADIPLGLDALVHRMVANRPHDRPASMAAIEIQLRALLVGHRVVGAAAAPPPPTQAFRWREPRGWWPWLRDRWQAARDRWRSTRPVLVSRGRDLLERARQLSDRHPRWTIGSLAAGLLVGVVILVALLT